MAVSVNETKIKDAIVVDPQIFGDERGVFVETFRQEWLPKSANLMVQGNRATRTKNTLVGLHFHKHQSDYWYVPFGKALAVLADIRVGSNTFGETIAIELSGDNHRGLYIPPGVAHGFYAITDMTITYLVDNYYNPEDELGVAWNDESWKDIWNISKDDLATLTISDRDKNNLKLSEWSQNDLPKI